MSYRETQPKLREVQQQQQKINKTKMKFNWRANWEILLILVIIVIGIVITTIAAIRSKDKHLLVLSDDTDYGQLIASGHNGINGFSDHHQHQVPPLPQTDFQMNSAQASSHGDDDGGGGGEQPPTPNESSSGNVSRKTISPKTNSQQQHGNNARSQKHNRAAQQHQQKEGRMTNGQQHAHHLGGARQLAKFEDLAEFNQLSETSLTANPLAAGATADPYETLSTEPTPSQSGTRISKGTHQGRRNANNSRQQFGHFSGHEDRASVSPGDDDLIDDFQTTRSLPMSGAKSDELPATMTESTFGAGPHEAAAPRPSLSLHGPYGLALPSQQHAQNRSKAAPDVLVSDSEDMMTSYSRTNLTDATQMMAGAYGSNSTLGEDQSVVQLHGTNRQRLQTSPLIHSLPFSVLLSDLIKLTRSSSMISPQASLEKPANSRPQYGGILQHLRSLPGPVLALLQGSTLNSAPGGSSSDGMNSGFYSDYGPVHVPTHDTSESNQYYQQIPMSSNDVLSLRATNPLPAFPAPKGTSSVWYPPTVGGNPTIHDAMNSNSDFVATNVAGFVRSSGAGGRSALASSHGHANSQGAYQTDDGGHNYRRQGVVEPSSQSAARDPSINNNPPVQQTLANAAVTSAALQASNQALNRNTGGAAQPQDGLSQAQVQSSYNNQQRLTRHSYADFGGQPSESVSKLSLAAAPSAPSPSSKTGAMRATLGSPKPTPMLQPAPVRATPMQLNTLGRQKRSIVDAQVTNSEVDEEEELLDSRPISIVLPDGRPMVSSGKKRSRFEKKSKKNQMISSSSQRQVNRVDYGQGALHHYTSQHNRDDTHTTLDDHRPQINDGIGESGTRTIHIQHLHPHSTRHRLKANHGLSSSRKGSSNIKAKKGVLLEAAGSGLMSKLLGTASTNDELEDNFDGNDDEDEANERRKEELEDAEFGIVNDHPSSVDVGGSGGGAGEDAGSGDVNRLTDGNVPASAPENKDGLDSSVGSGSTDSEAYTRRAQQQQRADVDFYGHPGEESRHLKYGILGSGNYEVVNGGIYPDSDESTAAVNSVANYVRKPGGVLLAGLSKLALGPAAGAGQIGGHHSNSHEATNGAQAAGYMPGGRIASGYMRDASVNPDEIVGFIPAPDGMPDAGDLGAKSLHNPLLDLIDANGGHLFDANLINQLRSSGSSSRTTFTSKDHSSHEESVEPIKLKDKERKRNKYQEGYLEDPNDDPSIVESRSQKSRKEVHFNAGTFLSQKPTNGQQEYRQSAAGERLHSDSSGTGTKSQGTNQFYSYQILPSKKEMFDRRGSR